MKSSKLMIVAVALLIAACGAKKDLDEMHDSTVDVGNTTKDMNRTTRKMHRTTQEMRDTTVEMNDRTRNLNDTTEEMRDSTRRLEGTSENLNGMTGELFQLLRQGDALMARQRSLQALRDAEDMEAKYSAAAQFLMAFEFQVWTPRAGDTPARRDALAEQAVREFMLAMQELVKPGDAVNPLSTGRSEAANKEQSFNAVSGVLHEINRFQEELLTSDPQLKRMSMLSLIVDGLKEKRAVQTGEKKIEELPGWAREVLLSEQTAAQLLQARYNFLGAAIFQKLSGVRTRLGGFWALMRPFGWKPNIAPLNEIQLREMVRFMGYAIETRETMRSLDIRPELNGRLRALYLHMRADEETFPEEAPGREEPARELWRLIQDYINNFR